MDIWLGLAGVLVGLLGVVVAVVIFRRQRADQREQEERHREEQAQRDRKIARRERWRAEYDEIHGLLNLGGQLVYRVRNAGPLTAAAMVDLGSDSFRMRAEQLSDRHIEGLHDSLVLLVSAIDGLMAEACPEPVAAGSGPPIPPDSTHLHDLQRLAVRQDRAASKLYEELQKTRVTLRKEWGLDE
jgi:hypothetical protein